MEQMLEPYFDYLSLAILFALFIYDRMKMHRKIDKVAELITEETKQKKKQYEVLTNILTFIKKLKSN